MATVASKALALLKKTLQATRPLTREDAKNVAANIRFLEDALFTWVPISRWESFLEGLSKSGVHETMVVAAKSLLERVRNPEPKSKRRRPWVRT